MESHVDSQHECYDGIAKNAKNAKNAKIAKIAKIFGIDAGGGACE
jgi:hypothetical protein